MTRLQNLSIRRASLVMLGLVTLLLLAFASLTWKVMQQSRLDLTALERINVEQASTLNRMHIASLEGLNRMDRALERQLRPSLGDPLAALQAIEAELEEMTTSLTSFLEATRSTPHGALRDTLDADAMRLIETMQQQLMAIRAGDRSAYRQLTLEAVDNSQALTESARHFYALADQQGVALLHHAEGQAQLFTWLLTSGLALTLVVLVLMAWLGQRCVLTPLQNVVVHFRTIAKGNLTEPVVASGFKEISQLFHELSGMQQSLVETVSHLHGTSHHVLDSAERLAQSNQSLAVRTRQQGAALEKTASHLRELTDNVADNAESANQVRTLANTALDKAQQGEVVMQRFIRTMEEIHEHATQVNAIVDLIDSIAFQTNILALNASVEAARAGDQGRGFGVVAGEVRSLASRSAEAAHRIRDLLGASRDSTRRGNELSSHANQGMTEIVQAIDEVNRLMADIERASQQQHDGIAQLNQAMDDMTRVTQDNQQLVAHSSQSAHALREKAEHMQAHAGRFRITAAQESLTESEPVLHADVWQPRVIDAPPHLRGTESSVALLK
ncbi:methyl-accepting chemotaxis protein [Halomonas sp. MCCC 1A11062]|uniref:methyl-accepting chemotaxis protein n=1 Tax=Halomonas sp. MCCC 1A11062 TaxID=2733485 RepID=UPI001F3D7A3C